MQNIFSIIRVANDSNCSYWGNVKGERMITSEHVKKDIRRINKYIGFYYGEYTRDLEKYITQQEKLTKAVKRYFELETLIDNHNYIPSEKEIEEYKQVRKEINEMVGVVE